MGPRQGRRAKYLRKADGEFEARLVALSCGDPPEGRSQWSLRLLADRAVELGYIDTVSHETVRRVLKKQCRQTVAAHRLGDPAAEAEYAAKGARWRESLRYREVREQRKAYLASIRKELDTIEAGQVPPTLLHELGRVYLDGLGQGGPHQAREELKRHLASGRASDQDLFEAVIRGFRSLVGRTELPSLDEIVRLHGLGLTSLSALPFLAGLAEDELSRTEPLQRFEEEALRRALGFYLLSRLPTKRHPIPALFTHSEDARPGWFLQALETQTRTVANAFAAVHRARVHAKELPDQHLHDMAANAVQRQSR